MALPQEFIDRVKREFPDNWFGLYEALNRGNLSLVRIYLSDNQEMHISPEEILAALDKKDFEQLRVVADRTIRRKQLLREVEEMLKQKTSKS